MADESTEQAKQAVTRWFRTQKRTNRGLVVGWSAYEMIVWGTALAVAGLAVLIWMLAR